MIRRLLDAYVDAQAAAPARRERRPRSRPSRAG
jgi:hypothetical protein